MKPYTNKTTTLATETLQTKEQIIAEYEKVILDVKKRHEYRCDNYDNCMGDFISPYHALADDLTKSEARSRRDFKLEMLEKGYCELESLIDVLTDLEGNVIVVGSFYGQYGLCFKTPNGFVGVPKKMSTLEKKGYRLMNRKRVYKAIFIDKFSQKGNPLFKEIEMVSETLVDPKFIEDNPIRVDGKFIDWLYGNQ